MAETNTNTGSLPSTATAAYQANNVAQVFMSFNRQDLVDITPLHVSGAAEGLQSGFLGYSDDLNLRSTLQRFEAEFNRGDNTSHYKLKFINPTTELEYIFAKFFETIYPAKNGVLGQWITDSRREQQLNSIIGEADDYYLDGGFGSRVKVPTLYIRWGYGTREEEGLSQIHKCRVSDIKYTMNPNQDKVVEIMLVDLFTFTRTSVTYNSREQRATVPWKTAAFPDGRLPGKMIEDLIGKYAAGYPEMVVLSDLYGQKTGHDSSTGAPASFGEAIDALVAANESALATSDEHQAELTSYDDNFLIAKGILEEQRERQETILLRSGSMGPDDKTPVIVSETIQEEWEDILDRMSEEQKLELSKGLNAPIDTIRIWDKARRGFSSLWLRLQALKLFFEQIGLVWSFEHSNNYIEFLGAAQSANQLDNGDTDVEGDNVTKSSDDKVTLANSQLRDDVCINLFDQVQTPVEAGTHGPPNISAAYPSRLSFWPMLLDQAEDPEPVGTFFGNINNIDLSGSHEFLASYDPASNPPGNPSQNENYVVTDIVTVQLSLIDLTVPITYLGSPNGTPKFSPAKEIKFFDIEGTEELNETPFWLFQGAQTPGGGPTGATNPAGQYVLLESYPEVYPIDEDIIVTREQMGEWVNNNEGEVWSADTTQSHHSEDAVSPVRPLTLEEKEQYRGQGIAPLFLEPGAINFKGKSYNSFGGPFDARPDVNHDNYHYSVQDLTADWPLSTVQDVRAGNVPNLPTRAAEVLTPYQVDPVIPGPTFPNTDYDPAYIKTGGSNQNAGSILGADKDLEDLKYPIISKRDGDYVTCWSSTNATVPNPRVKGNEFRSWFVTSKQSEFRTQPLYLEPTVETWEYMAKLAYVAENVVDDAVSGNPAEPLPDLDDTNPSPLGPNNLPPQQTTNGYLSLGTDGENPNISSVFYKLINSLNGVLVDLPSKLEVISMDTAILTRAQQQTIFVTDPPPLLANVDAEARQAIVDAGRTMLLISTGDGLNQFTRRAINRVLSFPEITHKESDSILYLDYATANSIITDLEFDGEFRWVMNIAQATFMSRFFTMINGYFEQPKAQAATIHRFLGTELQARIERLKQENLQGAQSTSSRDEGFTLLQAVDQRSRWSYNGKNQDSHQSYTVMDSDILGVLPGLVGFYDYGDLSVLYGEEDAHTLKILSTLSEDPQTISMVFPEADINPSTNESRSLIINSEGATIYSQPIMQRRVDFASCYMRINQEHQLSVQKKLMDTNFFFTAAMQQEIYKIEIETLGIPEIDNLLVEVKERAIILSVFDPRISTAALHWLSGLFQIVGFSHAIDMDQGYRTKLTLVKRNDSFQNSKYFRKFQQISADLSTTS